MYQLDRYYIVPNEYHCTFLLDKKDKKTCEQKDCKCQLDRNYMPLHRLLNKFQQGTTNNYLGLHCFGKYLLDMMYMNPNLHHCTFH
jgi:hypothetical protein